MYFESQSSLRHSKIRRQPRTLRTSTLFVNPELEAPTRIEDKTAVAEAGGQGDAAVADERVWGPVGEQTMHPFWAVRRVTAKQLAIEAALVAPGSARPRFNCGIATHELSYVNIGAVEGQAANTTRVFDVPFLVNTHEVQAGRN